MPAWSIELAIPCCFGGETESTVAFAHKVQAAAMQRKRELASGVHAAIGTAVS
jgi:hypothetical protein